MQTNILFVAALVMTAANIAQADEINPTWGDLSKLQGQEIYYKAQAGAGKAKEEASRFVMTTNGGTAAPTDSSGTAPVFLGVVGSPSRLKATFATANGGTITAKVGDLLPGAYRVTSIEMSKVILTHNKQRLELLRTQGGSNTSTPVNTAPAPMFLPSAPIQ